MFIESLDKIEYDVALSFAGEDRSIVSTFANDLISNGIKVFYDEYEIASLWGKDLYNYLADIYSNKAHYCIIFISKNYANKMWTNHERMHAQSRAFKENEEYILPIKIDDTTIPSIPDTIAYIDIRQTSLNELTNIIKKKLKLSKKQYSNLNNTEEKNNNSAKNFLKQRELASYVGSLYETLGFKLDYNRFSHDDCFTIIAEKVIPGLGNQKIGIACISGLNINESFNATTFKSLANNYIEEGTITDVAIIYDSFSNLELLDNISEEFKILRISELEKHLFGVQDFYIELLNDYRQRRIYSSYVPLSGEISDTFLTNKAYHTVFNVQEYIMDNINRQNVRAFIILADFGGGKTTLLERLKYEYAKLYLENKSNFKPVLVYLKEYFHYKDFDLLLEKSLKRELNREIPLSLFWKEAKDGNFVILLDGFDEMAPKGNIQSKATRATLFATLSKLFSLKSPCILSCRPAYFISVKEYKDALKKLTVDNKTIVPQKKLSASQTFRTSMDKYNSLKDHLHKHFLLNNKEHSIDLEKLKIQSIKLKTFGIEQVEIFLSNYNDKFLSISKNEFDWKDVKDFLCTIYDITDLMKRPILLDMIVQTVLEGAIDIRNNEIIIGPTSLYEIYTDMQFDRDWQKGKVRQQLLTKEQRRLFAQALAVSMFESGSLEITYENIVKVVNSQRSILNKLNNSIMKYSEEEIASDILICTFLTRQADELFKFTHRSFMEYFFARYLMTGISQKNFDKNLYQHLPKEVLYFLGGFGFIDASYLSILTTVLKTIYGNQDKDKILRRNISSAVLYGGKHHKNLSLNNAIVFEIDIKDIIFEKCELKSCLIDQSECVNNEFIDTNLINVLYKQCKLEKIIIERSHSENLSFVDVLALGLSMIKSNISIKSQRTRIESYSLYSTTLFLYGSIDIYDYSFSDTTCSFELNSGSLSKGKITNSHLKFCNSKYRLESSNIVNSHVTINRGGKIIDCEFVNTCIKIKNDNDNDVLNIFNTKFESATIQTQHIKRILFNEEEPRQVEFKQAIFKKSLILGVITSSPFTSKRLIDDKRISNIKISNCKGFFISTADNSDNLELPWRRLTSDDNQLYIVSNRINDYNNDNDIRYKLTNNVIDTLRIENLPIAIIELLFELRDNILKKRIKKVLSEKLGNENVSKHIESVIKIISLNDRKNLIDRQQRELKNAGIPIKAISLLDKMMKEKKIEKEFIINCINHSNDKNKKIKQIDNNKSLEYFRIIEKYFNVLIGYDLSKDIRDCLKKEKIPSEVIENISNLKIAEFKKDVNNLLQKFLNDEVLEDFTKMILLDYKMNRRLLLSEQLLDKLFQNAFSIELIAKLNSMNENIYMKKKDFIKELNSLINVKILKRFSLLEQYKKLITKCAAKYPNEIFNECIADSFGEDATLILSEIAIFKIEKSSLLKLRKRGISTAKLKKMIGNTFVGEAECRKALQEILNQDVYMKHADTILKHIRIATETY